jgi:hypothetical protein
VTLSIYGLLLKKQWPASREGSKKAEREPNKKGYNNLYKLRGLESFCPKIL